MSNRRLARIHHKFAALGLVGAVMVLLPMAQLLRYQAAEVQSLERQRAALDPLADTVALQRSLQAHGDAARGVLQGQLQMEPRRRQQQAEVDRQMDVLNQALAAGQWQRALDEAQALSSDWMVLAGQVSGRQIGAAQSDHAHRLRVEQALQVMDLLSLALGPELPDAPGAAARTAAALPRLAQQLAVASPGGDAAAVQAVAARHRQLLQSLRSLPALRSDDALLAAATRAEAQLQRLQRAGVQPDSGWPGTREGAVQAQLDLMVLARAHATEALDERLREVQQARAAGALAVTALGALSLLLLQHLVRETTHRRRSSLPDAAAEGRLRAESQPEAGRLMERLRRGREPDQAAPARDPQASQPPGP